MMVTINPVPCLESRFTPADRLSPYYQQIHPNGFTEHCTVEWPCRLCRPLGERLTGSAYDICEFSDVWYSRLTWNLTLAALCSAAATQALEDYATPIVAIAPSSPISYTQMKSRLEAMRISTARMILIDSERVP